MQEQDNNTTNISVPINNVRLVMECFCDLYTEGLTLDELKNKTKLCEKEIKEVFKEYKGLFIVRKFDFSQKHDIEKPFIFNFIYLRRARSLKCAYTIFKYSNMSDINFKLNKTDSEFINEISNTKYINRTFKSLQKSLNWSTKELTEVVEKWQNKGVICKKGKKIVFTYLGWPLWAAIIVHKIWLK